MHPPIVRHIAAFVWAAVFELTGLVFCMSIIGLPIGVVLMRIGAQPYIKSVDRKQRRKRNQHNKKVAALTIDPAVTRQHVVDTTPDTTVTKVYERFLKEDRGRYDRVDRGIEEWNKKEKPWETE